MNMQIESREKLIQIFFGLWLGKGNTDLHSIFSEDVEYTECYGPVYMGIDQVERWFVNWQKKGKVFSWDIKNIIHQNNFCVVEWNFNYQYDDTRDNFDGVTILEFDENDKIKSAKEFQSKSQHYYPYMD